MNREANSRAGGCMSVAGVNCARLATVTTTGFAGGARPLLAGASRYVGPAGDAPGRFPRVVRSYAQKMPQGADGKALCFYHGFWEAPT